MIDRRVLLIASVAGVPGLAASMRVAPLQAAPDDPVRRTDDEWRKRLTRQQYTVLRESGTEGPFTSPLNGEKRRGIFSCAGCEQRLFSSEAKFESGTGWPSFWAPIQDKAVATERDDTVGMLRVAVHCSRCSGHLGHVFDDGPKPTGLRYCMNGVAMSFAASAA